MIKNPFVEKVKRESFLGWRKEVEVTKNTVTSSIYLFYTLFSRMFQECFYCFTVIRFTKRTYITFERLLSRDL
ncbi:hypothetical protein DERP_003548, partial [Dermatophagoides pteronyssinus]